MKKIVTIVSAVLLSAGVFAQSPVSDPNVQLREAKNFHAISVSSAFDIFLTQGDEEKVAVSAAEEKDLANIIVEVKNGVLAIGWEHRGKWGRGNKKLKAYISFKQVNKISASGACNVSIVGSLKTDDLKLDLSGASDLSAKLEVKKLTVDLSGASDLKLSGTTAQLDIDASGASSFKGYDFSTDNCNVNASGASDIKITVNKELSADLSGSSDVNYKGTGLIRNIKTSGSSSVSKTGS